MGIAGAGMGSELRKATAEDIAVMQAIELDAARAYLASPDHAFCAALPSRDIAEHLTCLEKGASLLAMLDDKPSGFVLLRPVDGRAHILEAATRLDCQGRGIGRSLLAAAEDWAAACGYAEMTLTTYRDVSWNAPFYQRLGFDFIDPGRDRPELMALIAEEHASGFARAARAVMAKRSIGKAAGR